MLSHWNHLLLDSAVKTAHCSQTCSIFLSMCHQQNTLFYSTQKSLEYFRCSIIHYFVSFYSCCQRPLLFCSLIEAYQTHNSVSLLRNHELTVLIFILQKKTRYQAETMPAYMQLIYRILHMCYQLLCRFCISILMNSGEHWLKD